MSGKEIKKCKDEKYVIIFYKIIYLQGPIAAQP